MASHHTRSDLRQLVKPLDSRLKAGYYYRAKAYGARRESIKAADLIRWWLDHLIDPLSCFYCGLDLVGRDWQLDHGVPLSRGGAHVKENLHPACRRCNARKNALPFKEYMGSHRMFLFENRGWIKRGQEIGQFADGGFFTPIQTFQALRLWAS